MSYYERQTAPASFLHCRCGHTPTWHESGTGRCEINGPQPSDGCGCGGYVECERCEELRQ